MKSLIYKETLNSTKQVRFPANHRPFSGSIVVDNIAIPEKMAENIFIDPKVLKLLPPNYRRMFSQKGLLNLARLTVAPELDITSLKIKIKIKRMLVGAIHGRALPLAYTNIVIDRRMISTIVNGKGVLPSGFKYLLDENKAGVNFSFFGDDPIGFHGLKEAKREVEISRLLVENGAYSSLAIGYIELDVDQLRQFIDRYWKPKFPLIAHNLKMQLSIVLRNNDKPAYLIRLSAASDRLSPDVSSLTSNVNFSAEAEVYLRIKKSEVIKGIKIWERELQMNPKRLAEPIKINKRDLYTVFKLMKERRSLSQDNMLVLRNYVINLIYSDFKGVVKMVRNNPKYLGLLYYYFLAKDRDYALRAYDFELYGNSKYIDEKSFYYPLMNAQTMAGLVILDYLDDVRRLYNVDKFNDGFNDFIKETISETFVF